MRTEIATVYLFAMKINIRANITLRCNELNFRHQLRSKQESQFVNDCGLSVRIFYCGNSMRDIQRMKGAADLRKIYFQI